MDQGLGYLIILPARIRSCTLESLQVSGQSGHRLRRIVHESNSSSLGRGRFCCSPARSRLRRPRQPELGFPLLNGQVVRGSAGFGFAMLAVYSCTATLLSEHCSLLIALLLTIQRISPSPSSDLRNSPIRYSAVTPFQRLPSPEQGKRLNHKPQNTEQGERRSERIAL